MRPIKVSALAKLWGMSYWTTRRTLVAMERAHGVKLIAKNGDRRNSRCIVDLDALGLVYGRAAENCADTQVRLGVVEKRLDKLEKIIQESSE